MTCKNCELLAQQIEEMALDLELSRKDVMRLRRVEHGLRLKMREYMDDQPNSKDVEEIGNYWKLKIRSRANIPSDGKRAEIIRKALKRNSVNKLKRAIDGIALDDWAMGKHPRTKSWAKGSLKNDIQHIMGDETLIEKWVDLAEQSSSPAIDKVIERLDGVKETSPGQWSALCPAHLDNQHSLTVSVGEKGVLVNCFAGCEFQDIVKSLGMRPGELFDQSTSDVLIKSVEPEPLPDQQQILTWCRQLRANKTAMEVLKKTKGWTESTIKELQIGLNKDRLTIPIRDSSNTLVNLIKYKPGGTPKTLPLRGRERSLYMPNGCDGGENAIIVEGEADAITAAQNLDMDVYALPGAASWKDEWAIPLRGYDQIYIVLDCDSAGREAAEKVDGALSNSVIIDLEHSRNDGYDLTDFIMDGKRLKDAIEYNSNFSKS